MTDDDLNNSPELSPEDPIIPIDFTPVGEEKKGFSLNLSPIKVILGSIMLCIAGAAWFVLSARSVFIDVTPAFTNVEVNRTLAFKIGPRYLVLEGDTPVSLQAPGYFDLDTSINVGEDQAQTFVIDMVKLPGVLSLNTPGVEQAVVSIDGVEVGFTPLSSLEVAAGDHLLEINKERYEPYQSPITIEGMTIEQDMTVELLPAWAEVTINTIPEGALVSIDGDEIGETPLITEVLDGNREFLVKLPAHKAWAEQVQINARQNIELPLIELIEADGLVLLQSTPSKANVTLDGSFQGQTPLELTLPPGQDYQLAFFLDGYERTTRSIRTRPDEEASLNIKLQAITSSVEITAIPSDAELYINDVFLGKANQTIELLASSQKIEIRKEGFVTYTTDFVSRPGLEQKLNVELITLEQQRINSIKPVITTAAGQTLKLLYPGEFTMGASRREAGRQANEVLRNVNLTKAFYLSVTEVTNEQFAMFDSEHTSGVIEGRTLSNGSQPVVQVSWEKAALYCNWLSEQEGLDPFYLTENGSITGVDKESTGYRLPTEAEWAWAARVDGQPSSLLKFPWGAQMPPPENHGNYADITAGVILGRIIANYNDSFLGTAPVGSFPPNNNGFYDMGGNAAEWVHDYYGTAGQVGRAEELDPLGPDSGTYHVIRGSSWTHGTVTELRLSFRDYNNEPRDDVGFRVARYLGL